MSDESFTRMPNWLIDEGMAACSPRVWKVVSAVVRKTIGWHKHSDVISFSQFEDLTGIRSREALKRAVGDALAGGLIGRQEHGRSFSYWLADRSIVENVLSARTKAKADRSTRWTGHRSTTEKHKRKGKEIEKESCGAAAPRESLFWLSQELRPLAEAFIVATGTEPLKRDWGHWKVGLAELSEIGVSAELVMTAARRVVAGGHRMKGPQSRLLIDAIRDVQMYGANGRQLFTDPGQRRDVMLAASRPASAHNRAENAHSEVSK